MKYINQEILTNAIGCQQDKFNTHDIIQHLYIKFQKEYLSELMQHTNAPHPFTETHRQLGQELSRLSHLIKKTTEEKVQSTKTMQGKSTPVQEWQKVPSSSP